MTDFSIPKQVGVIMSELGNHLKQVREEKQLTLDDLQRTTKIQKRYLQAIESGDFHRLPGIFYARAFVKAYAEEMNLDAETLLKTYEHELPDAQEKTTPLPARSERNKATNEGESETRSAIPRKMIAAFLLVGMLFVVLIIAWQLGVFSSETLTPGKDEHTSEEKKAPASKDDKREEDNKSVAEEAQAELSLKEKIGNRKIYTLTGVDAFSAVVTIIEGGDSYVGVREPGQTTDVEYIDAYSESRVFKPDLSSWSAVEFNIGNAADVTLEVNGLSIEIEPEPTRQYIVVELEKTLE